MKNFLLLSIFVFLTGFLDAQILSGGKLTGNIKATDINGKEVDVFAELDAGRSVVLDIFATWCGPCWSFHNAGILKNLYEKYGPGGTNQIRVIGIEADSRTPLSHLYQQVAGTAQVPSSLGNWTQGVNYHIINSHSFNSILKISAFPTLYVIRPDRTVMDIFEYSRNIPMWEKALLSSEPKDLVFSEGIDNKTFCYESKPAPKVINMGTSAISKVELEVIKNGEVTNVILDRSIGVFGETTLDMNELNVNVTTDMTINIVGIDGLRDAEDDISSIDGVLINPVLSENILIVKFTTDFYPGETSWGLRDNKNRIIRSVTYKARTADQWGGGGVDANKEFTYEISINNTDINCLRMVINDSFGDGMLEFSTTAGHPVPGVEFYLLDGTLLKPKMVSDLRFFSSNPGDQASSTTVFSSADFTSGLADQDFVQSLNVYPNPANDILNVQLQLKDGIDYTMYITDIMGAVVSKVNNNTNFINVSHLNSGMYFLNVQTKSGIFAHRFSKI
jgi:thiol-disulfide isomerase/thioredoxin